MHSPLPDSSALEAGIIEDSRPSRLSRVQDNVRSLLRNSVFGSVHSSPAASPIDGPRTSAPQRATLRSPLWREEHVQDFRPEVLSSPSESSTVASTPDSEHVPGVLFPPMSYQQAVQCMAHQSSMFNNRAVAALGHPDMSDPSLASFLQQKSEKRQQKAWKRTRNGRRSKKASGVHWLLCLMLGLVLIGLLGTYLALATTSRDVSTTLHVLFVLGILLTSIVFAHTAIRVCFFRPRSRVRKVYIEPVPQNRRRRQHRNQHHGVRQMPSLSEEAEHYVPPTAIPVHIIADEVRPDTSEAQPSAAVHQTPDVWDKNVEIPNPPPAYGRWRGSVRADPELLHWQAVPSPTDTALPSPTYEESENSGHATSPPSYRTRNSPARTREMPNVEHASGQATEPEMVEMRGQSGVGLAV